MAINTRGSYIEFGKEYDFSEHVLKNLLQVPAPTTFSFSDEYLVDAERSGATGTMVLSEIGRTNYKFPMQWARLKNTDLWKITRWFEDHGHVFWCRYFNNSNGKIMVHKFYRGQIQEATPSQNTEILQGVVVPKSYYNYGFSVIDMGEKITGANIEKTLPVR